MFSEFWWGWVYGIVLTVAGLLIVAGVIQRWRYYRRERQRVRHLMECLEYDDEWDQTHG